MVLARIGSPSLAYLPACFSNTKDILEWVEGNLQRIVLIHDLIRCMLNEPAGVIVGGHSNEVLFVGGHNRRDGLYAESIIIGLTYRARRGVDRLFEEDNLEGGWDKAVGCWARDFEGQHRWLRWGRDAVPIQLPTLLQWAQDERFQLIGQ